jgi:Tfp pilus assembly protein PilF
LDRYTTVIDLLEAHQVATSKDHSDLLSVLLTNRAMCALKTGDCRRCINDCTKALELNPSKCEAALLRRAQAYEQSEKFKLALADYRGVLKAMPNNSQALEGSHRTAKHLVSRTHTQNQKKKKKKGGWGRENNKHQ